MSWLRGGFILIVGTGIDIVEVERIACAIRNNHRFIERFFTAKEKEYFVERKNRCEVIAGNFAAKEAFSKALGTGIRYFALKDIEILRDDLGKPYINLYEKALLLAQKKEIDKFHISISHCKEYAIASVTAEKIENSV
ncbi:MAG: holo-[acyl-carrier protein] synthase [Clostridiales bacterium]|jgi:holo-[acyl-carrier-protein] synthase|nr:holo-[acyl-carrier protein] synthase [Clostridiales bacterium]MDK2934131.1 holo-[acyl-carrier protein] synthase [Clostridiales bacterium]